MNMRNEQEYPKLHALNERSQSWLATFLSGRTRKIEFSTLNAREQRAIQAAARIFVEETLRTIVLDKTLDEAFTNQLRDEIRKQCGTALSQLDDDTIMAAIGEELSLSPLNGNWNEQIKALFIYASNN